MSEYDLEQQMIDDINNNCYELYNDDYVNELKDEIKKYQKDRDINTKRHLELKEYLTERIKYCEDLTGFDCCVEELKEVLKRI